MPEIHPTAVVAPEAELGERVEVGPFCVVGPKARLGEGTRLLAHAVVDGRTTIGRDCILHPFCRVGGRTQDLKYKGGDPGLEIGDRTVVRESVTINTATADGDVTRVGSDCLLMAYAHVAHDCRIGDGVIIANCGTIAGHVVIEDFAIVGGLSGVHQFVTIGRHGMIGGCAKVTQDVPPFMLADGNPLVVRGINSIGLKRREVPAETIRVLKEAFRILYRENLGARQAAERMEKELAPLPEVRCLAEFVKASKRGITR